MIPIKIPTAKTILCEMAEAVISGTCSHYTELHINEHIINVMCVLIEYNKREAINALLKRYDRISLCDIETLIKTATEYERTEIMAVLLEYKHNMYTKSEIDEYNARNLSIE